MNEHSSGADPGFQVRGGAHLKKLRRAEGGANIFGVFRVENYDFTPKNHIFPILGGAREIFGVFHVKNHDFTPKKNHIFTNFRGARAGARRVRPPLNPPLLNPIVIPVDSIAARLVEKKKITLQN